MKILTLIQFVILIVLLHVCPTKVIGQLSGVGVGAGGSFSSFEYGDQINSVNDFDDTNKGGGTGGIRFDFDLAGESLKLSPEFFVVQNGSKEYYKDIQRVQRDLINRKVSLDYLGLYLPLTLYIPMDDSDKAYNGMLIQGRGFIDYVVNGQIEDSKLGVSDVKFKSDKDKIDYGYSLEAGFIFQGMKLMIGYNWGIKNIEFSNALGDVNSDNYLINNKGFTIQVGYLQRIEN